MINYELMPHQKEAVYQSTFKDNLYLAWEMGVGKTPGIINVLRQKYANAGKLENTLILGPLIILHNWKAEFAKFSKIPQDAIVILEGPIKKRIKKLKELRGPRIVITNYESLQDNDFVKSLNDWGPRFMVADESHIIKSPTSKRAKNLLKISDRCSNRYLLSGTPILNSALDLWMQFRVLDKGETFGTNFFVFRHKYFEDENSAWSSKKGHFPSWRPRASTYTKLNELIQEKMLRVKKSDVLKDLPPMVEEDIYTEMSKEQFAMYQNLKRDFIAFVEKSLKDGSPKAVVANLAITKALRLLEIVSGYAKLETGEVYRFKENPRIEKLKEILTNITPEHKVIIWSIFKENYQMLREACESLGLRYVEIHGDIKNKEKFDNMHLFNTDPEVRVLIGNPGAGGVGVNLVAASYMIYYSRGFKLADDLQSEARNYRKGSEIHEKITRINLVTPQTIDYLVSKSLGEKESIGEAIIDNMREWL